MWQPPASPIEDRGTAIPIEDRDRAIPERLRLCGVIVKGLLMSLMWRKNDSVWPYEYIYIWLIDVTLIKSILIYYGVMVYCLNRSCFMILDIDCWTTRLACVWGWV